jgi:hypothetical protein
MKEFPSMNPNRLGLVCLQLGMGSPRFPWIPFVHQGFCHCGGEQADPDNKKIPCGYSKGMENTIIFPSSLATRP